MSITLTPWPAGERRSNKLLTEVLLIMSLEERKRSDGVYYESCEALDYINAWLYKQGHGDLDNLSSGNPSDICGGAFSLLKIDEFVSLVLSQEWKRPDSVMLLTKEREQHAFTVHRITRSVA